MQDKKKLFRTLGIIFFSTGILVGTVMFLFMNWAYFEAHFFFGKSVPADKTLTSLRCPLLMTTADTGAVTIRYTNSTDRDLSPAIQTEISYFGAARLERYNSPFAAGETRSLSWKVTSDDMVFGHLILARVFVFSVFTLPSETNTCGTVMVNLPGLTGMQLFVLLLGIILVCIATGWGMWLYGNPSLQEEGLIARWAMLIFTAVVLLGLLAGLIGWWGAGIICAVAILLLTISVVGNSIQKA